MSEQPPSIVLEPAPPETPRAKSAQSNSGNIAHGLNRLSTPSFPYGLSFSPTFNFNTPHGISPAKFFSPMKATTRPANAEGNGATPGSKDHYKFLASLNTSFLTADAGHQGSGLTPKNKTKQEENSEKDDEEEEEDGDDVWSSMNVTQQNQSNLTSIHENDHETGKFKLEESDFRLFQTPAKKCAVDSDTSQLSENFIPSIPSQESSAKGRSSIALNDNSIKRRRISLVSDTPNNRIAARIDSTMDSPVSVRRMSNANSTTSSAASDVWSLELDDVLIKSFHKYHKFKQSDAANELSILKKTSQNKVISRMIFNRTGILRTSKQISSRIFRLTKAGRLTKETKTPQTVASTSELEELIRTPLEELVNGQQLPDSAQSDALIDQELNMLFTSSPLDDVFDAKPTYKLTPKDFRICFRDHRETLTFTRLGKSIISDGKIAEKLDSSTINSLKSRNVPIWILKHDMKLQTQSMTTSTPLPKSMPPHLTNVTTINVSGFESIMTIHASCEGSNTPPMLTWYSSLEISKGDKILLSVTDMINGYRNEDIKSYTLQIPFVRTFFAGFINYLINGSAISSEEDIKVKQFIYNNGDDPNSKLDLDKSHIHAYLVHDFHVNGTKGETSIKIVNANSIRRDAESDDNETVVADSSPHCRISSTPQSSQKTKETPRKLKIDITRANQNHNLLSGPMTAPVYNSNIPNSLNRNALDELQKQNRLNYVNGMAPQAQQHLIDPFTVYPESSQNTLDSSPEIESNANSSRSMGVMQSNAFNPCDARLTVPGTNMLSNSLQAQVQGRPYMDDSMVLPAQYIQQQYLLAQQQVPQMQFGTAPATNVPFAANYQNNMSMQSHASFQPGQPVSNHPVITTNAIRIQPKQHSRLHPANTIGGKESRTKEITFGPILGYDPSKDAKITRAQTKPTNQGKGIHTFPLNEPVMYKPKK
ncbi:hypothetical protein I9W82_001104 [Candida metapsilosis]|uniref:TEA domain-containing protein n=1 Tax=Candida metapsilosis TaxID=273372 RepID=A0A8H7ZLL1_9ASCO|nr:hypothetical protein I9W82_001104 [Candida metapsilosis]